MISFNEPIDPKVLARFSRPLTLLNVSIKSGADSYFQRSLWLQSLLWFLLILCLKWNTITEPPVWDAAMGVFPSAIYLYENQFDILGLLQESTWWEGGANVHPLSTLTWFLAGLMSLTGSPTATAVLTHLTIFAINAIAFSVFIRALQQLDYPPLVSLLSGLVTLLVPLVLVQVGYLYTESLVMALGMISWAMWSSGKEGHAVAIALLAMLTKLTGAAIVITLCAIIIMNFGRLTVRRFFYLLLLLFGFYAIPMLPTWLGQPPTEELHPWGTPEHLLEVFKNRINSLPDIRFLIIGGLVAAALYGVKHLYHCARTGRIRLWAKRKAFIPEVEWIALLFPFAFVASVIIFLSQGGLVLPRYLVPIIPFSIVQFLLLNRGGLGSKFLLPILAVACLYSVANSNGAFYDKFGTFSQLETTHAYKRLLTAQQEAVNAIRDLPEESPIYVSREIDYFTSSPMMGYVDAILPNTVGIYKKEHVEVTLDAFPSEFYALFTGGGHGGTEINIIVREASESPDWTTKLIQEDFPHDYPFKLWHVERAHPSQ